MAESLFQLKRCSPGAELSRHSPLMFAAHRGHYLIVKTLLAHGADVFALANNGWTAKRAGREGQHGDVMQLLERAEKKLLELD
jgi:ankyrin repeat protein